MKENYLLEIACFEITSAEIALKTPANRIEFCREQILGGLTPNIDEFRYLKSIYSKPIYVMIRPSAGSFLYSDREFHTMKEDLIEFKNSGADGFVFGILTDGDRVDLKRNSELIELASGTPCTFHRAFDWTPDLNTSCQELIDLGFKTVLTSGGQETAVKGKDKIKKLVEKYHSKIEILIGGGVRSTNIQELKKYTGAKSFHSSAIPPYESYANEEEIKRLLNFL